MGRLSKAIYELICQITGELANRNQTAAAALNPIIHCNQAEFIGQVKGQAYYVLACKLTGNTFAFLTCRLRLRFRFVLIQQSASHEYCLLFRSAA